MRHPIDPKIDCVFKALLGSEANRNLLVHFLNAMLGSELPAPVVAVVILNPYNEREFVDDKLSVVDVKARDQAGHLYQIEIQLVTLPELPARIVYGWADLYSAQLASGDDYSELKPTYAIWLLGGTLLPDVSGYAHRYRLCDDAGRTLLDHGGIALFELGKFAAEVVDSEAERWLKFFIEGEHLDPADLPDWMNTPEMRQAMSTVKEFSEKDRAYHAYQARRNYQRQQQSIAKHLATLTARAERAEAEAKRAEAEAERAEAEAKRAEAKAEHAQAEAERERLEKDAALAELERLRAQIKDDSGD